MGNGEGDNYPIIRLEDEPEIHRRLLVEELLEKWKGLER